MKVMLDKGAIMPTRAHDGDAGLDLYTPVETFIKPGWYSEAIGVAGNGNVTINTGVHVQIPYGYVGLLKSRSGLNVKNGITGEGVIDYGYTGSIIVRLYNHNGEGYHFNIGDKIIQLVIVPCDLSAPELVDHFEETERGNNGFGSTGK